MKKIIYIAVFFFAAISLTGCYADRGFYGPPAGPVVVGSPYYYRPAPVVVGVYGGGRYYGGRGRHGGWSHGRGRY